MLTAALVLSLAATPIAAQGIACPNELAAAAIAVTQPPAGWTGFVPSKLILHGVGVSTGPLAERAMLKGDHRKLARGAFTVTFSGLKRWGDRTRWLTCQYGDGDDIVLAARLPETVDNCVVSHTPDKYGDRAITVACK
jgi:hypothetical protein